MKFSLSWLKEHLETDRTLEEISDTLTLIGLEVEDIYDPSEKYSAFKTCQVISAEQHPNADRLRVCMVDTGSETVQVVCGAPNARTGMKGVFAPSGTVIPGTGVHLKPSTIRGVESNGMLCSEREMEISEDHDGIIDLAEDTPVGVPFADVYGLNDPVIEIGITPDRSDCLGVYGIARDLAAYGIGTLHDKPILPTTGTFDAEQKVTIDLLEEQKHLCPAFAWRLVKGVKNGPSPDWIQTRLRAIGLRPINFLVDVTNLITHDRGRPLHVFDADKVKGDICVRLAKKGDKLLALDGKTYEFNSSMVVISDDNGVESIAGIMGGEDSGCDENTTNVIIESALWDPINVARTGRALNIISDARYRFERGVDPAFTLSGVEMATQLILEYAGGEPSSVRCEGEIPESDKIIEFPPSEVLRLSGLNVEPREIKVILNRLGFWTAGDGIHGDFKVAVPSWRHDVDGKADLVEEVVRIAGLHRVPSTPMSRAGAIAKPILTQNQKRRSASRRALAARGMLEAVTWSFIAEDQAKIFGGGSEALKLANPISSDMSDMRPSLLPGLMLASQRNADRGISDTAIFEVGQTYHGAGKKDQYDLASGIRKGSAKAQGSGRHWLESEATVTAFDAKADALAVLAACGAPVDKLMVMENDKTWYHPGRSATLRLGPKVILAEFGEMHPGVMEELDVKGPMVGFEVYFENIPAARNATNKTRTALKATNFQPVRRDFAFVVEESVNADALIRAAKGAEKQLIQDVNIFDLFDGKKAVQALGEGKKSLALEVILQPLEKTLTDDEIEEIATRIVEKVTKATGAQLRG